VVNGGVARGEESGHSVMEVVIRAEVPDVRYSRTWLVHAQEHVDSHLLVRV